VRTVVDQRLLDEAKRFAFRFACEDCAHFDVGADRCSLSYPATPRREDLSCRADLELCKTFECA
jgi:hypothetical protein